MKPEVKLRLGIVVAVTLVALWLIWPTFHYFLAVSGKVSATPEEIEALRKKSVPLGLDLQGGVDVLLEVDEAKLRNQKVQRYADEIANAFKQESPPIDATVEMSSGTESIVLTLNKAEQRRAADVILKRFQQQGIFPDYDEAKLEVGKPVELAINRELLQQDILKTVDSALKVIRDRVDKLGVTQPVVVKQGVNRIRVQLPGEKDPEMVVKTIIRPAQLEFRAVRAATQPIVDSDGRERYPDDSASYIDVMTGKPLPGKQVPAGYEVRPMKIQKRNPQTGELTTEERYILVKQKVELTGEFLADSWVSTDPTKFYQPVVHLEFKPEGAKRFEQVTRQYEHKPLAVLLDGVVYTAPNINQVISEGSCIIEGAFDLEEAHNLSLILKAGALPAELVTKEKRIVEATLGADSIRASVYALAVGSVIVAAYMIAYYGVAGLIADIALLINVLLIFAFMKLANATLTLSGIGGILLTVGMAVDANILIYERIREELRSGKALKMAIHLGFGRAFSVIFDANLTTLISGLTLLQFGAGSVKGFALSLNIGILATLFTGLFCTHAIVDAWFSLHKSFSIGRFEWLRPGIYLDFLKWRKLSYLWSGALFLASALYILPFKPFPGSNWGVDFEGGLLTDIQVSKPMTVQQIQGPFSDWRVQKVAGENMFLVRMKFVSAGQDQIPATQAEVVKRLNQTIGEGNYRILGSESVSNEVGSEFTRTAIIACIIASIGILVYLWFRFELLFGVAAVVALFHDLIITYGVFNMLGDLGWAGEVTLDVVAALLVILGYSVNDTIIIFDRVRENMKLHPAMPLKDLINRSISESLNRTVNTVGTVIVVLVVMLLLGGKGLHDFALVLLIGVIKGTYSSSFVASPLLFDLHNYMKRRQEKARRRAREQRVALVGQ
ncbi:MAG: protein translocase subunit SecD [Candidatus Sumerlaea chitinivorans]|nr:protein translocase subunit SecD [Candidatus Sumerlaea chitinivorans]